MKGSEEVQGYCTVEVVLGTCTLCFVEVFQVVQEIMK